MPGLWHKDFHDARIVACPDGTVIGKSFGQIADERGIHPLDAFLDVLVDNVSMVTVYRNSFNSEVRKGGIDGLVASLSRRNQQPSGAN